MNIDRIQFYMDYFALIAESGIDSAQSMYGSISTIQSVNSSTFTSYKDAIASKNNLFSSLKTAYENVFTNALSTTPMVESFKGLSKYILDSSGQSVNDFLSENGIHVKQTYASISQITGESINESNII